MKKNSLYHSDYNALHFVKYDYHIEEKYHQPEIYDDWFEFRGERWISKPKYIQKYQLNDEFIQDQIITNGLSDVELVIKRCSDAVEVNRIPYTVISPQPIVPPDILMEVIIDFSLLEADQYFFVVEVAGIPVAISERIELRDDWCKTILWECKNSRNLTGVFFSTGYSIRYRLEGLVMKWQPDIEITTNTDEEGDTVLLHQVANKKRKILIGPADGLPDYMYLKASKFCMLDDFKVEGISYVSDKENKLQEQDRVIGHPMYHYELEVHLVTNELGVMIEVPPAEELDVVIVTTDAEAFGYGGGQLIDIIAESE